MNAKLTELVLFWTEVDQWEAWKVIRSVALTV